MSGILLSKPFFQFLYSFNIFHNYVSLIFVIYHRKFINVKFYAALMSGVVSGIPLESPLPRASIDPVLADLYFLFRHNILATLCGYTWSNNTDADYSVLSFPKYYKQVHCPQSPVSTLRPTVSLVRKALPVSSVPQTEKMLLRTPDDLVLHGLSEDIYIIFKMLSHIYSFFLV